LARSLKQAFPVTQNCPPLAVTGGAVTPPSAPVKGWRFPDADDDELEGVETEATDSSLAAIEVVFVAAVVAVELEPAPLADAWF